MEAVAAKKEANRQAARAYREKAQQNQQSRHNDAPIEIIEKSPAESAPVFEQVSVKILPQPDDTPINAKVKVFDDDPEASAPAKKDPYQWGARSLSSTLIPVTRLSDPEASAAARKVHYAKIEDDGGMPEAGYQEYYFDQACLILEEMSDATRQRFFAHLKGKYLNALGLAA
jgi:hypothetical protein